MPTGRHKSPFEQYFRLNKDVHVQMSLYIGTNCPCNMVLEITFKSCLISNLKDKI